LRVALLILLRHLFSQRFVLLNRNLPLICPVLVPTSSQTSNIRRSCVCFPTALIRGTLDYLQPVPSAPLAASRRLRRLRLRRNTRNLLILGLEITLQHYQKQPIIAHQLLAVTFNLISPYQIRRLFNKHLTPTS
jgi:hypothetical protein